MMSTRYYNIVLGAIGLCLCFILTEASKDCDLKSCPGPLYYYEELGCTPIFENSTSCCPTRYNCDNWKNLPKDKCLVNGHEYKSGEKLLPREVKSSCWSCFCKIGSFVCSTPSCAAPPPSEPGCYYDESSIFKCCDPPKICEDDPVTCTVDGNSYKIGEKFRPLAEPEKTCYCDAGYDGVNDERFCTWRKPSWCNNVIHRVRSIRAHCAPIYSPDSSPQVHCNEGMRCYEDGENRVIRKQMDNHEQSTLSTHESVDPAKQCILGKLKMNIGDKLNKSRDFRGFFSTCICEVPPVPTCRYIKK